VVGTHHRQLGLGIDVGDERRGQPDGVGGVAGDGFEDQPVGAQLGQRRAHLVAVAGRRAHPDAVGGEQRAHPLEGLQQQAVRAAVRPGPAHDVEQLLGAVGAGQRPQPRA
jgi:hypothetical protein